MISQKVIDLCKKNTRIVCNLGPEQIPQPKTETEKLIVRLKLAYNTIWVDDFVMSFLRNLRGGEKVLTLIRWFPGVYTTVVLEVRQVYWDSCGYPRLDLVYPKDIPTCKSIPEPYNGTISIWGAFIVAIAKIKAGTNHTVQEDPELDLFERLVGETV